MIKLFLAVAVSVLVFISSFGFGNETYSSNIEYSFPTVDINSSFYRNNPFAKADLVGQCTWFTYGRIFEALSSIPEAQENLKKIKTNTLFTKGADKWLEQARGASFEISNTPQKGDIACWSMHVAFVEQVLENNNVLVTESNLTSSTKLLANTVIVTKDKVRLRPEPCKTDNNYVYLNKFDICDVLSSKNNCSNDKYTWYKLKRRSDSKIGWAALLSSQQYVYNFTGIKLIPSNPLYSKNTTYIRLMKSFTSKEFCVSGKVIDERGNPVSNARVAFSPEEESKLEYVYSNKDGYFNKCGLLETKTYYAFVEKDGYECRLSYKVIKGKELIITVYIKNNPTWKVFGRVLDGNNAPIPNSRVAFTCSDGSSSPQHVFTDRDGNFQQDGFIRSKSYNAFVSKDGYKDKVVYFYETNNNLSINLEKLNCVKTLSSFWPYDATRDRNTTFCAKFNDEGISKVRFRFFYNGALNSYTDAYLRETNIYCVDKVLNLTGAWKINLQVFGSNGEICTINPADTMNINCTSGPMLVPYLNTPSIFADKIDEMESGCLVNKIRSGISLSWNSVQNASSYDVYFSMNNQQFFKVEKYFSTNAKFYMTPLTKNIIKIGSRYRIKIKAIMNDGSESDFSNEQEITFVFGIRVKQWQGLGEAWLRSEPGVKKGTEIELIKDGTYGEMLYNDNSPIIKDCFEWWYVSFNNKKGWFAVKNAQISF